MKSLHDSSDSFNQWLGQRRWRIFVFCVPVLLAAALLLVVVILFWNNRSGEVPRHYERMTKIALEEKNFELARVASLRGLAGAKNERDRAQWIFYLAMAMGGQGQRKDAAALISEAAPLEPLGAGNIDAHLMLAQNLLSSTNLTGEAIHAALVNPTNATAKILHNAEQHLLSAAAIEPDSVAANELLGRFYINTHQPEKARSHLMRIYVARPETALLLALDADMEGDAANAVLWAERALTVYEHNLLRTAPNFQAEDRQGLVRALLVERKYTKMPATAAVSGEQPGLAANPVLDDSPTLWLGIVRMLLINGKVGEALRTLEQRLHENADPNYKLAVGEVCSLMVQNISPKSPGGLATRLRFIEEGITNAPGNVNLMFLLTQAADATDETGFRAKTLLAEQLASAPKQFIGYWHFMAAREYDLRGDKAMGRSELRLAWKLTPQDPLIGNQAAYYQLTSTNQNDWAQGLGIIDTVLKDSLPGGPNEASFHGTRGLLLARLGRGKEAAADLEFAVAKMPNATEDRQALAKINGTAIPAAPVTHTDVLGQTREMINNGDFATAAKTLEQSLQGEANPSYATALADVCAAWVEYLPYSQHEERLRIIQKGLSHDSQHAKLQAMLIQATHTDDASGQAAVALLEQLAAGSAGQAGAEWRFLWGQDARKRNDLTTARKQLELAYGLDSQNTKIEFELARVLASGNQQDWTRGLGLIEHVVAQFPNNAEFREVRGQILASLNRNQEALDDLGFAVDRLLDPHDVADTRRNLVKVYTALGKTKKAEEQRQLLLENP